MRAKSTSFPALLLSALALACSASGTASDAPERSMTGPYFEAEHEGRIYVLGSSESRAAFAETHHLPYTQTMIGAGPAGETVVLEVDTENPWLQERLWAEFESRHMYYVEIPKDGRVYVLGSPASQEAFEATGHLPYTSTLIGAGAGGETLVFEVDKENPYLAPRLKAEYSERHDVEI